YFGNGILNVSAGETHTILLNSKNQVQACGSNKYGQLGIQNTNIIYKPTLLIVKNFLINKQIKKKKQLKDIKIIQISCGSDHTFAISNKGQVYSWGLNLKGQLGIGSYDNQDSPILIYSLLPYGNQKRNAHNNFEDILVENLNNQSKDNTIDQLNKIKQLSSQNLKNSDYGGSDILTNILLENDEYITQIQCGTLHTIALSNKNRLFSTGYGETYALGHANNVTQCEFSQIQMPNKQQIKNISCGLTHTLCVIGQKAYIWGVAGVHEGLIFQNITELDTQQDTIVDVKAGDCLSLLLSSKGDVYCLGENIDGQLCNENLNIFYEYPKKINNLPSIGQIQTGKNHCIVISIDNKSIYGWGSNTYYQITGKNSKKKIITQPYQIQNIQQENNNYNLKVECGSYHTLILSNKNLKNQLEIFQQKSDDEEDIFLPDNYKKLSELQKEIENLKKINQNLQKSQDKQQKIYKQKENEYQKQLKDLQKYLLLKSEIPDNNKFDIKYIEQFFPKQISFRTFNSNLEIDFNEIHLEKQINEGGYGIIYRAKWRECTVAVKKFKIDQINETIIRDFLSECHAMEALRHPNIVMFLGACTKPPNFCIILELCQRGSLWNLLQTPEISLSWEDKRKLALDTARGVHYLHQCTPPIIHRDLKSLNILLDENLRCKLADFGWTKAIDNYMSNKIGTYQWMAPEVISSNSYTEKADVFSYGIILWEIASREPPYRNKSGQTVSIEVIQNDLRPSIPKKTPETLANLMKRCWDKEPQKRPSFKEIIKILELIILK
ncbi:protein kinase, putative, partial [Ichthyophthirius multifiliis]